MLSEGIVGGGYYVSRGLAVGNSRMCEGNEMQLGWEWQGLAWMRQAGQERPARALPSPTQYSPTAPGTLMTLSSHPKSCLLSHEFIHQHFLRTYSVPGAVLEQNTNYVWQG